MVVRILLEAVGGLADAFGGLGDAVKKVGTTSMLPEKINDVDSALDVFKSEETVVGLGSGSAAANEMLTYAMIRSGRSFIRDMMMNFERSFDNVEEREDWQW